MSKYAIRWFRFVVGLPCFVGRVLLRLTNNPTCIIEQAQDNKHLLQDAVDILKQEGNYKGRYTLETGAQQCQGGSGVVLMAHVTFSARRVALKFFLSEDEFQAELKWCQMAIGKHVIEIVDFICPDPLAIQTSVTRCESYMTMHAPPRHGLAHRGPTHIRKPVTDWVLEDDSVQIVGIVECSRCLASKLQFLSCLCIGVK